MYLLINACKTNTNKYKCGNRGISIWMNRIDSAKTIYNIFTTAMHDAKIKLVYRSLSVRNEKSVDYCW